MAPYATLIVFAGIIGLFWLDRRGGWVSRANFVPFCWLLISMSRPVTSWTSAPQSTAGRAESYLEGSAIDRTLLLMLILLAVVALWKRKEATAAILRKNAPIILFLLYCLISVSWAEFPLVSFKRWIRAVGDVLMILVILTDRNPENAIKAILSRIGYLLIPLSILFIRFFPDLGRNYSVGGRSMWTGVCTDKNALGALCMIIGAVSLWRWLEVRRTRGSPNRLATLLALGTVFSMTVYLLPLVDSKTAQMCFLFATIVVLFRWIFKQPWAVFLFTVGTVAACYAVLIAGASGEALEAIGRDESLTGRTRVWAQVLRYADSPWFGAGYENFWIGDRLIALSIWGGNQSHNGYVEIYVNLGWVGLLFLAIVILAGYRAMMAYSRTNPDVGRLKAAFYVICLTYNFSESAFKMMAPVWMMFLWATMSTPVAQTVSVAESTPEPEPERSTSDPLGISPFAPARVRVKSV
jgi:exopolysaccharide production protein ExoQ